MNKGTLIRNIIISAFVAELCLTAFVLSFQFNLSLSYNGTTLLFKNVVWGCKFVELNGKLYTLKEGLGLNSIGMSVVPAIGLFLILFAAVASVLVAWFLKKPFAKWVLVGLAAIILAGAIMQFFVYSAFIRAFVNELCKENGVTDKEQIKHVYEQYKELFDQYKHTNVMSVVAGVLGILGAIGVAVPKMIPEKN